MGIATGQGSTWENGIHWNTCDQRQYGAQRRKLTCLIFNVDPKMLAPLFTKCDNKTTRSKEKTTAQPFLGRWPRYRQLLAMLLATEVDPGDQPALTVEDGSFLTDVLELGLEDMAAPAARHCSLADFQSLLTWTLKPNSRTLVLAYHGQRHLKQQQSRRSHISSRMHQLQNLSRQPINFHQVRSCVCTLTDQKQWQPSFHW